MDTKADGGRDLRLRKIFGRNINDNLRESEVKDCLISFYKREYEDGSLLKGTVNRDITFYNSFVSSYNGNPVSLTAKDIDRELPFDLKDPSPKTNSRRKGVTLEEAINAAIFDNVNFNDTDIIALRKLYFKMSNQRTENDLDKSENHLQNLLDSVPSFGE